MWRRLIAGLALVATVAAPAAAQLTVKGDAQAWQDVVAAYQRLTTLRTYRVKISGSATPGPVTVEVVNPDRRRTVATLGTQRTTEVITVGRESRTRVGTGPWQCQGPIGFGFGSVPFDPKAMKGEVTVSRVGPVTLDGTRMLAYRVAYGPAGTDRVTHTRLYVLADSGLPRRSDVYGTDGKVSTTIDFFDFNAPITIELPKCT